MSTTPDTARARTEDPATSHEAAADAERRRLTIRDHVLATVRAAGRTFTLAGAVELYRVRVEYGEVPPASDSGIRTRVAELTRDGDLELTGETVKVGRRPSRLYRVAQ